MSNKLPDDQKEGQGMMIFAIVAIVLAALGLLAYSYHDGWFEPPKPPVKVTLPIPPQPQLDSRIQENAGNIVEYEETREPVVKRVRKHHRSTTCVPDNVSCGAIFTVDGTLATLTEKERAEVF